MLAEVRKVEHVVLEIQEEALVRAGNEIDYLRFGNVKPKAQVLRLPDQEECKVLEYDPMQGLPKEIIAKAIPHETPIDSSSQMAVPSAESPILSSNRLVSKLPLRKTASAFCLLTRVSS